MKRRQEISRKTPINLVLALVVLLTLGVSAVGGAPPAQEEMTYTVKLGDSLWALAEKYLGSGSANWAIVGATNAKHEEDPSFAHIENPGLIYPGWKLLIPSAAEAVSTLALAPGGEDQFREAVMATENAFQSGDVDRIIEFYAEDAISMPPGFPVSVGKEAIEADLRFFFDEFALEREFTLVDYEIAGDYGTRWGEWTQTLTPKAGGDPVIETGRCVLGFKKVGDEWKIAWEIWNTYGPPAAEEATALEAAQEETFVEAVWANENAFQSGDVDRIIEFYAEEAISMPPGFPVSTGKEAIKADLRFFFDEFALERQFTLVDYEIAGDYGTRWGEWTQTLTPKAGGDPVIETGRCTLGWRKFGDEWKVVWEIWNTYEPHE